MCTIVEVVPLCLLSFWEGGAGVRQDHVQSDDVMLSEIIDSVCCSPY